jgi:hypothetical protein
METTYIIFVKYRGSTWREVPSVTVSDYDELVSIIDKQYPHHHHIKVIKASDVVTNSNGDSNLKQLLKETPMFATSAVANRIIYYNGVAKGIVVSDHAIRRYRERTLKKIRQPQTDAQIEEILLNLLDRSQKVEPKGIHATLALVNHDGVPAQYYERKGWIIVVVNGTIATVHHGETGRWRRLTANSQSKGVATTCK